MKNRTLSLADEKYRSGFLDMAYLSACAADGKVPDAQRVGQMDLRMLYRTAERHQLTGITAMALERAGVKDAAFTQAKGKAVRRAALFEIEREAVLAKLEEAGIWYMPMKGCVLKNLYPAIGMRQMADIDILFDASRTDDVRMIMEGLGFAVDERFGRGFHDHYFKPPVCNFEMHRKIFGGNNDRRLNGYYRDVRSRLLPDEGSTFGCHFSDEDFYLYMTAHAYRHYSGGGTGLRSFLDTYVYIGKKGEGLDWKYIAGEAEKLGIADFEAQSRKFARHLFGGEALTASDEEMLEYILSSGTYGTVGNWVNNRIAEIGNGPFRKTRYVIRRIFLPMSTVRYSFPVFAEHPVLLPFLPFYRLFTGLAKRRSRLRSELRALAKNR